LAASVLGYRLWWPDDPIAGSFVPFAVVVESVGALFVGGVGSMVGYQLRNEVALSLKAGMAALVIIAVLGVGAIAGNGALVTQKISRDRVIAEERVRSLYQAAARTVADSGETNSADDSAKVRSHYKGPAFDDEEWQGTTRNFLRRNGFVYQLHIAPPPGHGIVVCALPIEYLDRVKDGFCIDDSGRMQIIPSGIRLSPSAP
jgi:hypothetical protein